MYMQKLLYFMEKLSWSFQEMYHLLERTTWRKVKSDLRFPSHVSRPPNPWNLACYLAQELGFNRQMEFRVVRQRIN